MKIIEAEITKEEKRKIGTAVIGRTIVLVVFLVPILYAAIFVLRNAFSSVMNGKPDTLSMIFSGVFLLIFLWGSRFIVPFYKNSVQYAGARTKQIIETTILEINHRVGLSVGLVFYIKTDYCHINTGKQVIHFQDVSFMDLRKGMKLYLHVIPGTKNEFLRISAHPEKPL
ncbi:hypothetical protein JHJ32_08430 [Parapedobacter sp. ISTM3]|jgi:hypothetical protein|uniref:hypothetical protein n=1 Tax=Parapedobacter sp. ISTM3 TaxID=2800130 RepID=UPI0019047406|nr:hypothetical protein [Parapedobacter sp. ISTM3]MBK1440008.1 hypothetical protein [Parapedobacter sp. ISTM3]